MTEEEQEAMQKEIQKQVKETYARMNDNKKNNFGAKYRKEKREQAAAKSQEEMAQEIAEKKVLKVTEFVTVNDLATLMNNTPVNEVIKATNRYGSYGLPSTKGLTQRRLCLSPSSSATR